MRSWPARSNRPRRPSATGCPKDRIILSAKVSGVQDLIDAYRAMAAQSDYALHLGLTEAGLGAKGIVATTAALSVLLQEGIGDTIRASLTPLPDGDRTEEVFVSQQILQSLGIRSFAPQVTACPGCGRTTSTFFQDMADQIQNYLRERMPIWKEQYAGVEEMKVAVMGCVVNGPGESKHANLGISLPGTFEEPVAPVYVDGKLSTTLRGDAIVAEFIGILNQVRRFTLHACKRSRAGHCLIAMPRYFTLAEARAALPAGRPQHPRSGAGEGALRGGRESDSGSGAAHSDARRHAGGHGSGRSVEDAARFQRVRR